MGNLNEDKSEFNSALIYLQRLHIYFHNANNAATNNDMFAWIAEIENLFRTLYNWIKDNEEVLKRIKKAHEAVLVIKQNPYSNNNIPSDLYWELNDLHLLMQKAFHESGFETKTVDFARNTMRGK